MSKLTGMALANKIEADYQKAKDEAGPEILRMLTEWRGCGLWVIKWCKDNGYTVEEIEEELKYRGHLDSDTN